MIEDKALPMQRTPMMGRVKTSVKTNIDPEKKAHINKPASKLHQTDFGRF